MSSQPVPGRSAPSGILKPPTTVSTVPGLGAPIQQHFHEKTLCLINVFKEPGKYDVHVNFNPAATAPGGAVNQTGSGSSSLGISTTVGSTPKQDYTKP